MLPRGMVRSVPISMVLGSGYRLYNLIVNYNQFVVVRVAVYVNDFSELLSYISNYLGYSITLEVFNKHCWLVSPKSDSMLECYVIE